MRAACCYSEKLGLDYLAASGRPTRNGSSKLEVNRCVDSNGSEDYAASASGELPSNGERDDYATVWSCFDLG